LVALIHHPLSAESGLPDERGADFRRSEQVSLTAARRVVVTSRYTAGLVADLAVPVRRIDVVEPGTDPAPVAKGSDSATLNLLCVATLTYRKGHDLLIDALAGLRDRHWHLICVGSLDRDPATVSNLRDQLADLGLAHRVTLTGELESPALAGLYHRADVFVLATRFEGYGMALAEALARGLPVLSTHAGAVTETVPNIAGLLIPPDDPESLARALVELMDSTELRERLAQGARIARGRLPSWRSACERMDQVLRAVGP
jgi:glycosyltransferase involved in cell wall biosynthesis